MEFLHAKNDNTRPVDALRINWYYRPKDIGRKIQDTRLVFATMHSDISPLTALRGKCQIQHRAEIASMDEYRKRPDSFWFEKLYDRYIQKNYDLIPTPKIVNVPDRVKIVDITDDSWLLHCDINVAREPLKLSRQRTFFCQASTCHVTTTRSESDQAWPCWPGNS